MPQTSNILRFPVAIDSSSENHKKLKKNEDSGSSLELSILHNPYEKNHRWLNLEYHRWTDKNQDVLSFLEKFLDERSLFISPLSVAHLVATFKHYNFLTLADFARADLQAFLAKRGKSDWKRKTLDSRIADVFTFANWLCDNHITNRRHRVKRTRKPVQREMPENAEIDLIFEKLRENYQSASPLRRLCNLQRYLITCVIYETGCRISEACSLFCEDVRLRNSEWFILIRGTKTESAERTVKISTQLFNDLNDYRNTYGLSGRLFSSARGNQINAEEFSKWIRKFCEKLQISCKIHPHLFRYLFIVRWFREGKDGLELSHRLGHASIQMTYYYAKQVQRLCHDIDLSESISILERQKNLNAHIYNKKPTGW